MNGYSAVACPIVRNVLGGNAFVIENIVSSSIFVAGSRWFRSLLFVRLNMNMLSVCLIISSSRDVGVFVM